jgi:hypothetical protein
MDTTQFIRREVGPGLCCHSTQLANNVAFHIAASSQYSLEELLKAQLKREIMIEICGVDDRRWGMIANDPLFSTARHSRTDQYVFLAIANRHIEDVFEKVCELAAQ